MFACFACLSQCSQVPGMVSVILIKIVKFYPEKTMSNSIGYISIPKTLHLSLPRSGCEQNMHACKK